MECYLDHIFKVSVQDTREIVIRLGNVFQENFSRDNV